MLIKTKVPGLKATIITLLDESGAKALTIGQISAALGLNKVDHPDISACLNKLKNENRVRAALGPASSPKGRRFVKHYTAVKQKPERIVVVQEMDARRSMAFTR